MKSDTERLIQCILCDKDPEACGASEKDEDSEGLCLKYRPHDKYMYCGGICEQCETTTAMACNLWRRNDNIR